MVDNRKYLEPGSELQLCDTENGTTGRDYKIVSVLGSGSSAIAYDAVIEKNNQAVRLKEYYPVSLANAERINGILYPHPSVEQQYMDKCKLYCNKYYLRDRVALDKGMKQILNNYVQEGRVLYAANANGRFAARYIECPALDGLTLESYLEEIRQDSEQDMIIRLKEILEIVKEIAAATYVIHQGECICQDLKPSNILILRNHEKKPDVHKVSLIDIGSMEDWWEIDESGSKKEGSKGFMPDDHALDYYVDIYGIGATLYYSLAVLDKERFFRQEQYGELSVLVRQMSLLKKTTLYNTAQSEMANGIHDGLVQILQGCLAKEGMKRWDCKRIEEKLTELICSLQVILYSRDRQQLSSVYSSDGIVSVSMIWPNTSQYKKITIRDQTSNMDTMNIQSSDSRVPMRMNISIRKDGGSISFYSVPEEERPSSEVYLAEVISLEEKELDVIIHSFDSTKGVRCCLVTPVLWKRFEELVKRFFGLIYGAEREDISITRYGKLGVQKLAPADGYYHYDKEVRIDFGVSYITDKVLKDFDSVRLDVDVLFDSLEIAIFKKGNYIFETVSEDTKLSDLNLDEKALKVLAEELISFANPGVAVKSDREFRPHVYEDRSGSYRLKFIRKI